MRRLLLKKAISVTLSAALLVTSFQTSGIVAKADKTQSGGNRTVESDVIQITDESKLGTYSMNEAYRRVGVHDPSVIQDPKNGRYYIFGSHCAWAWSDDLENWTAFNNNVTEASAVTIFKDEIVWCKKANSAYNIAGNLWAPDVIWNESMKKWCMYMSINGPKWNSTISLLTADTLDGNWTYVGPVIQSGMSNGFGPTFDYEKVMGNTDVSRFISSLSGGGNPTIEAHAIDPCVIYDDAGDLWMTYGSWSGGISMIKLDKKTGLRDYNTTYPNTNNKVDANKLISDPYTGYKIAGGTAVSGEGSYLQKIGDYYFLFMSYGGYAPDGGYNMRIFRSKDVKGPYVDVLGKDARTVVNGKAGDTVGSTGMRLMSYYKWSFAPYGYTAQGHNSAIIDKDSNKAFVIYHNKYNDGTAAHEVRVHQLLMNEDGWTLAAPFEYAGETVSSTGYSQELFTGSYSIMFQKPGIDHGKLECAQEENIKLEAGTEVKDSAGNVTGYTGKISGGYEGTWTSVKDKPYISLTIGNNTYKGVLCEGTIDESDVEAMTFTAVGSANQECLWGYKVKDSSVAIKMTIDRQINLPDTVVTDISLPTVGVGGSTISWRSNSIAISDEGKVFYLKDDTTVSMTATITNNGTEFEKTYTFVVPGSDTLSSKSEVVLKTFYKDEELDMSKLVQGNTPSFVNPFSYTHENISNGASISFDVTRTAASDRLSNIISLNNKLGKFYFTGGSYLGYNNFNGYFFDANLNSNYVAGTDYLKTNTKVNIKLEVTAKGVAVYQDGKEVYSTATLKSGTTPGGYSTDKDHLNPETTVMSWLKMAPEVNFGSGNFWNDLIFKGKLSNVKFAYTQPKIDVAGGGSGLAGSYTQDYEDVTDVSSVWTSPNAQDALTIKNNEAHGNYVAFTLPSNTNSRGMHSDFGSDVTWENNYILEFDLGFKSGNNQGSQFAVTTTNGAYTDKNENNGLASGYVLKLSADANATKWYINDSATEYVELPVADADLAGWVHVKITGNTSEGKATLEILNGETSLYNKEITMNNAANIKGFYVLAGRYMSIFKIDNIAVKRVGVTEADFSAYKKALTRAEKFVALQTSSNAYTKESIEALENAIAKAKEIVTPDLEESQQDIVDAQTAALNEAVSNLEFAVYKVSLGTYKGGTVTGLAADGSYQGGSFVELTAAPAEGYEFLRWEDESGNVVGQFAKYSAMITGNITLIPIFKDMNQKEPVAPQTPTVQPVVYTPTLKLSDIELPNGWTWENPSTVLSNIGTNAYPAVYKTTDPEMYIDTTAQIQVTVEKAEPEYTPVTGLIGILGQKLSTVVLPSAENGTWAWMAPETVMTISANSFDAVFTPSDSEHYNVVNCKIVVTLKDESGNDVIITPEAPTLEAVTYEFGLVLGNVALPTDWKWKESNIELAAGQQEYDAIYVPNGDIVKILVTVLKNPKPNYAIVKNLKGVEGDKLSTVLLPKQWKWKNPSAILSLKENKYMAIFTHSSGNYEDIEVMLEIVVTAKKVDDNTGGGNTNTGDDKNNNNTGNVNKPSTSKPQKGKVYTVGGMKYKVLSTTSKTVSVVGLTKTTKKKKTITIKKTVKIMGVTFKITEIGNNAFASCKKLNKVTIGTNVTKIGKKAFYKCSKLKNIVIRTKKLKSVGKNALKGINKKAVIKVPRSKLKKYKKLLKKKGQSSKVKIKK